MTNPSSNEQSEMREEYELPNLQPNPYAEKIKNGSNLVLIEPEIFKVFPSSDAVNEALRLLIKAAMNVPALRKAS